MTSADGVITAISGVLEYVALGIDLIGVLIILYGFVLSLIGLIRSELGRFDGGGGVVACMGIRRQLGVYILTGIEFMIASDIIHTVVSRELESLYFVSALVVIRTVISFFLGRELAEQAGDTEDVPGR